MCRRRPSNLDGLLSAAGKVLTHYPQVRLQLMNNSTKSLIDSPVLHEIVGQYQALLTTVDDWFSRCQASCEGQIHCVVGCSACCRGLFDISLLDAFLLQIGFRGLSLERQKSIRVKALDRLRQLQGDWPELRRPYLLNRCNYSAPLKPHIWIGGG